MINALKVSWENFHKLISNVVLSFKGDAEKFYPAFYKCISDAENPVGGSLNKHASLLLGCFQGDQKGTLGRKGLINIRISIN